MQLVEFAKLKNPAGQGEGDSAGLLQEWPLGHGEQLELPGLDE